MGRDLAEIAGQAALGGDRRGLRQGLIPETGDGVGDDDRQLSAKGRGALDHARASSTRSAWPAANLWGEPHRLGQAGWPASRLDHQPVRPVWLLDNQTVQDVLGDLASGWGRDPGGAK